MDTGISPLDIHLYRYCIECLSQRKSQWIS